MEFPISSPLAVRDPVSPTLALTLSGQSAINFCFLLIWISGLWPVPRPANPPAMSNKRNGKSEPSGPSAHPRLSGPTTPVRAPAQRGAWLFGLLIACIILTIGYQIKIELDGLETRLLQPAGNPRLDAISQQMSGLRGRLHGLMADSVEMRLKSLERNLATGHINGDDLQVFQSLQRDLQSLETFAGSPDGAMIGVGQADHPRYQALAAAVPGLAGNAELLQEISRLRTLLYLCLTGLVVGGVVASRSWIASHQSHSRLDAAPRGQHLPAPRSRSDHG